VYLVLQTFESAPPDRCTEQVEPSPLCRPVPVWILKGVIVHLRARTWRREVGVATESRAQAGSIESESD